MPSSDGPSGDRSPQFHRVRVEGHLASDRAERFAGLPITNEAGGEALLTGPLPARAAPHGVARGVRNPVLPLLGLRPPRGGQPPADAKIVRVPSRTRATIASG